MGDQLGGGRAVALGEVSASAESWRAGENQYCGFLLGLLGWKII